jgi:hypothetical protein
VTATVRYGSTMRWTSRISRLPPEEEFDRYKELLLRQMATRAERCGYTVLDETVSFTADFEEPGIDALTLHVELVPRYDGHWGELRRMLAEDGLLPPGEPQPPPAPGSSSFVGFTHDDGSRFTEEEIRKGWFYFPRGNRRS